MNATRRDTNLARLYWAMRIGIACIWVWTAIVSWWFFPHAQSIEWLRRLGLTSHTNLLFTAAFATDAAMGIASLAFASRWLWQAQFVLVAFYTVAVAVGLPEFLVHPFGPVSKNLTVLACLAYLAIMEPR
jgi:hypothetical protein